MKYIRTKDGIYKLDSEKCFYAIRDTSVNGKNCYVSYLWDNWKNYFLIDSQNCVLFSYSAAQTFIGDLMQENLNYKNLVIEINQYYKDYQQADTIEELVDEFVVKYNSFKPIIHDTLEEIEYLDEKIKIKEYAIYGAIWTDKGLIYVAKMDSDGRLVLI